MLPSQRSTHSPNLIAIILAAGKGVRFGMPKLNALFRGKSFLQCIVDTLAAADCQDVFIAKELETPDMLSTLRYAIRQINARQIGVPSSVSTVSLASIASCDKGTMPIPTSSDETCEAKLFPQADGYLIFPVDHPAVLAETVILLCDAFEENPKAVIRPLYQNKSGHPIIIPCTLDIFGESGDGGLGQIIRNSNVPKISVPVSDAAVIQNINIPSDVFSIPSPTDD